ncbi:uncharacterized protein TRIADDRAFT_57384 [Trichoplax adhaerens]|uniref:Large subunit GTPase 1 homolog n=1 Tax=Trichoplax adhaerens TaxID=10228 RepID=B3RZA7_TRIAD|nr:hypothetical protein TRIADDRAFT_57384 [Trichoplax adhaerens]EDV23809.1 hypothetical protein TRIADDRAFT_57384 [Trichoplax adhaerens]|eukprot:XP_002113335.1 hypothetical protein TRIADDRAFT_57384 [Trichoplax adhaerens]
MGKKNRNNLGRSIQKDRFAKKNQMIGPGDEWLHSSQIDDDSDWARLNLHSVTEQSSLDDFLATAQLAGTEFAAEKLNIKVIDSEYGETTAGEDENQARIAAEEENKKFLRIPRRPAWTTDMSADELQSKERDYFLTWRKQLSEVQENNQLIMTPFEKNLELWRQLWRVIERSHIIVQIVDARNPLLFRCEDLEAYVKEVDNRKINLLLLSKADLLTSAQRLSWAKYLKSIQVNFAFWSANMELEADIKNDADSTSDDNEDEINSREEDNSSSASDEEAANESRNQNIALENDIKNESWIPSEDGEPSQHQESEDIKILNGEEIITLFKTLHGTINNTEDEDTEAKAVTIGLVGYPNVGKSSTINALFHSKKVSVSATPGKTKHFQTLHLDKDLCLCDCPGLVFPSFVSTKAEMITCGILPIDQMRDWLSPVALISF